MKKQKTSSELKEELVSSGLKAVEELIKVLNAEILKEEDGIDIESELGADKLKNAAAAKRLAFDDAQAILTGVDRIQSDIDAAKAGVEDKKFDDFTTRKGG